MKNSPEPNKPVLAYKKGENIPYVAYYDNEKCKWYEAHTHWELEGVKHWETFPEMKNTEIGMSSAMENITVGEMNPLGSNALKQKFEFTKIFKDNKIIFRIKKLNC